MYTNMPENYSIYFINVFDAKNIWFEKLLNNVSVEKLGEDFSCSLTVKIPGILKFESLVEYFSRQLSLKNLLFEFFKLENIMCLYELPKPLINFELLVLSIKAELLSRKIIICHYKLVDSLRQLLRKKEIKSVKKTLLEAKKSSIISEIEYDTLINFVELRNKVLHYGYLSCSDEENVEKLKQELEKVQKFIRWVINEVKVDDLEDFVECLQEPLRLS
jgi:uncharacterized protein YutE (UPF0331/DUF86 family)